MKKNIFLILKGILIGFGKIIPGVSGSLIAMSLGVYETAIHKVRYFFKNIEENMTYFFFLGIGVLIAIIFGSRIILYALENYYTITIFLFSGLVFGVVPSIKKKIVKKDKQYYVCLILTIIFLTFIFNFKSGSDFVYKNNLLSNIQVIIIGFLEAFTMIVPGISGTAIFMNLGYYNFLMNLFSHSIELVFSSFNIIFIFGLSFILSTYFISSLMNYLLSKKEKITYSIILGFSYVSMYFMFKDAILSINSIFEIVVGIILFIVGLIISMRLE